MSGTLQSTVICPHCGDRYNVEQKQNKDGDVVRRGLCPNTPPNAPSPHWSTPWEVVMMKVPAMALTDDEVVEQEARLRELVGP